MLIGSTFTTEYVARFFKGDEDHEIVFADAAEIKDIEMYGVRFFVFCVD